MYEKILITFVAILTSMVIYYYILEPKILKNNCFLDTGKCIRLKYYSKDNSILFNVKPYDLWVWFNNNKAYIYNYNVNDTLVCEKDVTDKTYEAVYVIDPNNTETLLYECIISLDNVVDFYLKNNAKTGYFFYKPSDIKKFDIYELLSQLDKHKIINIYVNKWIYKS